MFKYLTVSATFALMMSLPSMAQEQPKRAPSPTTAPVQQQRATGPSGNVACPASVTAAVNPGGGWNGGSYTGSLFNLSAMDGSRTDCIYKIDYVIISKPAPAGQKCTVAPDKKSFNCK